MASFLTRLTAFHKGTRGLWLAVRVHIDAFLIEPRAYLTATKWWILRKRVRAQGLFARLLSQSPKAYELWTLREQREYPIAFPVAVKEIIALVFDASDEAALVQTLSSLRKAGITNVAHANVALALIDDAEGYLERWQAAWILPIRAGDLVSPWAGLYYQAAIMNAKNECSVIYADDDVLDPFGHRKAPYCKPDWNSELTLHHDIITGACIVRRDDPSILVSVGQVDGDSRLVAAAVQKGSVEHVRAILHHRRSRPAAPMTLEPLATIDANLPPLSVIIPTRNRKNLLRTCIMGLRATRYPNLEIIVANNESDEPEILAYLDALAGEGVRVLDQPGPFNYSTINNNAVAIAQGELLCLMNNDIEVLAPDWLAIMATQALRPEVGAVGALLLYPDSRIQHAGVVIGVGNAAGHAHRFLRPEAEGYFRRHALPQFISAVTGACLVVRKDKFLAVGGLDEENFAVAFNDVDLCLKLNQRGWQSFYEPRAVLVHHESVSRGFDTDPVGAARFAKELAALQRIWQTNEIVDPYHHPMLSRASEQFALDLTSTMVRL